MDLDAFFASVEQLRNPLLQGRPVAVGSGVIVSASCEARAYGLAAGMTPAEARRRCPGLAVVAERHAIYRAFADQAFALCAEFAPHVETHLDQADCDLTGTEALHGGHVAAGRRLQDAVWRQIALPVTIGLGPSRVLAALAALSAAPRGLGIIPPADALRAMARLPIERLPGIGPARCAALHRLNVRTVDELHALPREALTALFGLHGHALFERSRGRDALPLSTRQIPHAITRTAGFDTPETDDDTLAAFAGILVERAACALRELDLRARVVTVAVQYRDAHTAQHAHTLAEPACDDGALREAARTALRRAHRRRIGSRHISVSLSRLAADGGITQPALDDDPRTLRARRELMKRKDAIRRRWGARALRTGSALLIEAHAPDDDHAPPPGARAAGSPPAAP